MDRIDFHTVNQRFLLSIDYDKSRHLLKADYVPSTVQYNSQNEFPILLSLSSPLYGEGNWGLGPRVPGLQSHHQNEVVAGSGPSSVGLEPLPVTEQADRRARTDSRPFDKKSL